MRVKLQQPNKKITATWPSHEQKVVEYHCDLKISDFKADDINLIEVELIKLQRTQGINQLIGDHEMEELIEFFLEQLKDFTLTEIKHAFRLKAAQLIDVQKRDQWQVFTAGALMPTLIEYRKLRAEVLRKYFDAEDKILEAEKEANKPKLTKEQIFIINKQLCEAAFDNYKNKIPVLGLHKVFDILWELNLIPYTVEKMNSFELMAVKDIKSRANQDKEGKEIYHAYLFSLNCDINIQNPKERIKDPKAFDKKLFGYNSLIHRTKELATQQVFAYLVETETDITKYFDPKTINEPSETVK